MLERANSIQSKLEEILAHIAHVELISKESFFGRSDLVRELNQLKYYLERLKARELKLQLEDYTMNIEFEPLPPRHLTFSMVEAGELFVCSDGNLYQKSYDCEDEETEIAWMICDSDGDSQGRQICFAPHDKIERILPKIKRISF